jgi:rhamnogalacturonan endolyase
MFSLSSLYLRRNFILTSLASLCAFLVLSLATPSAFAQRQMERLNRGIVAVPIDANRVFVSWRLLGTEPADQTFNLYRSSNLGTAIKLNDSPLAKGTNFTDTSVSLSVETRYFVRALINAVEQDASESFTLPANPVLRQYLPIALDVPASANMPDGSSCSYSPNDCSLGDLDGDGEYEIVVKWDPSNSKDNSQSGYTGNVYLDAYKLNGTKLWRIDLGRNIRAGAHYTQFMVYDLDGDGRAEVACKTADGSIDGLGRVIGDATRDYRNVSGYILSGPEFLSVFAGATGAEIAHTDYNPPRGNVNDWGDNYGNRVDRFLACVAYLDGKRPSLVMCRGYYTRAVLVAYDFRGGDLTQRWIFDSADGTPGNRAYEGQGNHNLSVADVDGDGRDEIIYGAAAIDDNGKGLYNTHLGHGDALHVSDMDPSRPGLELWSSHEDGANNGNVGLSFRDARTGEVLWRVAATTDIGRGIAMDIDPRYPGYECWGATGGLYSAKGELIPGTRPGSMNFGAWWDGDFLREILDSNYVDKWNPASSSTTRLLTATGCSSNNGTKSTPCLSVDIYGDWREEVIWRSTDNRELRIYTTTIPTVSRLATLMHDPQYRLAVAWQNVAYNQPPHPGFFLGDGMSLTSRAAIATLVESALSQPNHAASSLGGSASFQVSIGGAGSCKYRWQRLPVGAGSWSDLTTGATYIGTGTGTLTVNGVTAGMLGDQFRCVVSNAGESVTSQAAALYLRPAGKLYGLSTRAFVGTADDVLIMGFIVSGPGTKRLLIRGRIPMINGIPSAGAIADPSVELRTIQGAFLGSNDNWTMSPNHVEIDQASRAVDGPLSADGKEAALLVTLGEGIYCAIARGSGSSTGVSLLEIYEADDSSPAVLRAISSRGRVVNGEPMIAGTVTRGAPRRCLVQALGPSIAGVTDCLANPKMRLVDMVTGTETGNDDWSSSTANRDSVLVAHNLGGSPLAAQSKDAALVLAQAGGVFTVVVESVTPGASGVALVEVYDVTE